MNIYESVTDLIGNTPLVRLSRLEARFQVRAGLFAKIEGYNPAGSAKDRVALRMIRDAERSGKLAPGATIVEPTSGNTGIGLCAVSAVLGYHAVIVMPDNMSEERIRLMRAYGAEVVLTPGTEGMSGAIRKAEEIRDRTPGAFIPGQFDNPSNPSAHYETTGPEIFEDMDGTVDVFVAGVGTGGTVTGVGRYLKEKKPDVRIVAVEPARSPLLSEGRSGAHGLQGIGANFVPSVLDTSVFDEVVTVTEEDAFRVGRELAKTEGILAGITSGAALSAAITLANRPENEGKRIVVLLPDSGERYLSTALFAQGDEQ